MFVRVAVATAVRNPFTALALVPYFAPRFLSQHARPFGKYGNTGGRARQTDPSRTRCSFPDGVVISASLVRRMVGAGCLGAIGNICFRGVLGFGDVDVLVISMAKNGRHSGAGPNCSSGHCFRCLDEYGFEVGCRSFCGSEEFPQDCRYWSGGDRADVDDILVDIGLGRLPYASISSDMSRCIFSSVCDCRDCRFARRHGCFQVRIIGQRRARAPW